MSPVKKSASDLLRGIKSSEESIDWLKGYQERLVLKLFGTNISKSLKEIVKKDISGINEDIAILREHVRTSRLKLQSFPEE